MYVTRFKPRTLETKNLLRYEYEIRNQHVRTYTGKFSGQNEGEKLQECQFLKV